MDGIPAEPSASYVPRSKRTFALFAWVVIITGLINGGILVYKTGMGTPVSFVHFAFVGAPLSRVQEVHLLSPMPSATRLMVPGKQQQWIIDTVVASGTRYYLIFDPKALTSNLFIADKQGKLTQITDSSTFKFWLSYNPESQSFLYESDTITDSKDIYTRTDWTITTFSLLSKKEAYFEKGFQPEYLTGALAVAREGSSIVALPLTGASSTPLIHATLAQLFATAADGKTLALYNPITHAVDLFDTHVIGTASYLRSFPAPRVPTAMAFVGSHVLLASREGNILSFQFADLWGTVHVPAPVGVAALKLTPYE